ncbi:MFS transporter [Frigoribacterium salinisoli]
MTASPAPAPPADARRARLGVALLFLTNGALFANLLPRYPGLKADLDLSNTAYGLAVVAVPVGAIAAGLAAGVLVRRLRSSRVALGGTLVTAVAVLGAAVSPSWAWLAAALFVAGAMDAITDVAQNSHGLRVQHRFGRSIINSFHAVWSIGAVLGGLMGGLAATLDVPRGAHLAVSGLLFAVVAVVAYRLLLPGPEPQHRGSDAGAEPADADADADAGAAGSDAVAAAGGSAAGAPIDPGPADAARASGTPGRLVVLGLLAAFVVIGASGTLVEDAGQSWAALYLTGSFGTTAGIAALGFVALQGAQFVGRMLGDRLVDRFGQRAVARTGGALVLVGFGLALAFPSVPGTIAGFAAAGLGVATLVPAAMQGADELPGLRHGTGLAVVSWLMRIGFLLPPVVGAVADASSLRVGLIVVPISGLLVVVLSQALSGRRRRPAP